jgi:DNA-binding GntR family transcriptional regulator
MNQAASQAGERPAAALAEGADGTLSDHAYRLLADQLVSGRLAPGDRLSLRQAAQELGISVMPVREAMSRLAAENALVIEPKRAATVPLMSAAGFRDLTRVRIGIEGMAAAMAATAADPATIEEIARREAAFRALADGGVTQRASAVGANQAFHFALYRAAGSAELLAIIERLWLRAGPVLNLDLRENPERLRFGGAVRYHAAILAAVRAGDAEAAREALAGDIEGAAAFILSQGRLPEA